jgi:methyltransferase
MVTTHTAFGLLGAAVAVQRLFEMRRSRRNERRILAAGGREHAPRHFGAMAALHGAWLAAMLIEVHVARPPLIGTLALVALLLVLVGQGLRYAAMRSLDWRWTVRIMTLPDAPAVSGGIYRYLRHPNYVGVALEIVALPLVHTAWRTALIASALNAIILAVRVRAEEAALSQGGQYVPLQSVPRFLPAFPRDRA